MLCFLIYFSQFVSADTSYFENRKHLIIDFGGKYVKAGLDDPINLNVISLTRNKDNSCDTPRICYNIPNSISASVDDLMETNRSEDAIRIGEDALKKARKNQLLGIEYFGTLFNRKKKYISANHDLFNIDENVTISDYPFFWYLKQFLAQYKNKTGAETLTVVLPGYCTDVTYEEFRAANNNTFKKINFFKDHDLIQNVKKDFFKNQNILFLDLGAFSAKVTIVNSDDQVIYYGFNEQIGLEKVASDLIQNSDEFKIAKSKKNIDLNKFIAQLRPKAIEKMKNPKHIDRNFEYGLRKLFKPIQQLDINLDEVIIIGGGASYPFVIDLCYKLLNAHHVYHVTNAISLNHTNFFVEAYMHNYAATPIILKKYNFHQLYLKYNNQTFKLPKFNPKSYAVKINLGKVQRNQKENATTIYQNHISIVSDKYHVIGGMSPAVLKYEITLNESLPVHKKYLQIAIKYTGNYTNSLGLRFKAALCNQNRKKELVDCYDKLRIVRSNVTLLKYLKAMEKAKETDAAMAVIRALSKSMRREDL